MQGASRAGFGRTELRPALGVPLMGYGARQGTARGRHDPLYARALFLEAAPEAGAARRAFLLVELDLCLVAVPHATAIRARIAQATGLAPAQVTVACIHSHSAPDTALLSALLGRETPREVAALYDAAVTAAISAVRSAQPARLGWCRVPVSIGRNRRLEGGPVEPDALVLRFDREDGAPLAVVFLHGCHPTALGHDNLELSADWPGAASRAIERALPGAAALFVLGAHADVDPRTRGLLDLAIPDQSLGVSFDEMEALGREVGEAVARAAESLETQACFPVDCRVRRVALPLIGSGSGEGAHRKQAALRAVGLPDDADPGMAEWYERLEQASRGCDAAERRRRASSVRLYLRDRTAARVAGGVEPQVELQVVRIGAVCLLGLPLEVTADVGCAWRRAVGEGGAVVSIANGWLRYLPHAEHFRAPGADACYEILNATFEPCAAERLVAAGAELARQLAPEGGGR